MCFMLLVISAVSICSRNREHHHFDRPPTLLLVVTLLILACGVRYFGICCLGLIAIPIAWNGF
jgi:hypothetical protein